MLTYALEVILLDPIIIIGGIAMQRSGYIDGTSYRYNIDIGRDDVNKEGAHVNILNSHGSRVGRLEVYRSGSVSWSSYPREISHNDQVRIENFFERNAYGVVQLYNSYR